MKQNPCVRYAWAFVLLAVFLSGASVPVGAQQSQGTLRGKVTDELGGLVVGATVTAADASGVEKTATTDEEGNYAFTALPPGAYTVRVAASGFGLYENLGVEVTAGRTEPLDIVLTVAIEQEEVTVTAESPVSTDPEGQAGAVVLRGEDLDALPDDPDDLAEALQALAGPSVGAEGGAEIFLDGFTGGRLPPKESIREIRINRNPFSAEYDRLGYGRVEIFTKPGTDKYRGQAFFNFNDESLNSRLPNAPRRAPYQSRRYGGNVSGPLSARRASFFFDFERRETDENEVINAIILDPLTLEPTAFDQVVLTPQERTSFGPRLDYQINASNTLVARYTYERGSNINEGVGGFSLPERAFDTSNTEHRLQLTETAIINQKVINETRFQFIRERRRQEGGTTEPTLRVLEAFTGGGAQAGRSATDEDRFELQNYTSWTAGNHSLKAGARLRSIRIRDVSLQNFGGTFTFGGGLAPQLDANDEVVLDAGGSPVIVSISSIERFRRTRAFQLEGLSAAEIRARGGGATQFSVTGGNPEVRVSRTDFSPFIQDDWRMRPNLTLSLGLRAETQTNLGGNLDLAPRVAFAWAPGAGGGRQQTTVIRGGFGIFYERFREGLTLQALRFDGSNQRQFLVTSATAGGFDVLDLFPAVPTTEQLTAFQIAPTVRRIEDGIRTPYTMQTAISIERQLPYRSTISVNFINARTLHVLRSRNINAPLPGTFTPGVQGSGVRPFPGQGSIFQYESSGRFNQQQLIVNFNTRFSTRFTLSANYTLNRARGDAEGAGTFPVNQYDLSGEYGRSLQDIRHRFFLFGTINALPWGIRLNPMLVANSGRPFNITVGRDLNGDTLFTERPAFANDLSRPGVVVTPFGTFDPNPTAGQTIIPRNFGTGPSFFAVNLRASKTVGFGGVVADARAGEGGGGGGRGGRGSGGGGGRRGGGGRGGGGEGQTEQRYSLTFSVNVQNLLNNTNLGTPVGNLSSPLFGQSFSSAGRFGAGGGSQSAGNRRIELQVRFGF
ncbi:MAG TPA: carboxypeptidase regulatory-like domain-containing protein [Pyrinomonadaceae bacterium]|nr:carboxypeptidase regulatory-like domain-containing protein [Pyrinomonadaceae bacterium]